MAEDAGEGWDCSLPDGNAVACPRNLRLRVRLHHTDKLGDILYQRIHSFQRSADRGSCVKEEKMRKPPGASQREAGSLPDPFGGGSRVLQGHSMAFSPAQSCFAHPPCVRCNTGPSAFVAAAFCCLLQVLHFPLCSLYRVQNRATQAWGSSNKPSVSFVSNPPLLCQGAQHRVAYCEDTGEAVPLLQGWHCMGWKCTEQHTN